MTEGATEADPPVLEVASAGRALDGAADSGDLHVFVPFDGGALLAVIDGLGHGPEAARASRAAAEVLASHAIEPVGELVQRCHERLRRTRGAVMTVCAVNSRAGASTWLGIGNVEAELVRFEPGGAPRRTAIAARGGVVGYRIPPLKTTELPLRAGDTLVMATDGIRGGFGDRVEAWRAVQDIADRILAEHGKQTDDALVCVARYLPGARS